MIDNLGLSFGLIIALFVPGFVLLSAIIVNYFGLNSLDASNIKEVLATLKDSYAFILSIYSIVSLTLGLLLDSIRYLITWTVQTILHSKIDTSLFKEEDCKYFDWIVENNFRFHQFYSNLCLGLLIAAFILKGTIDFCSSLPIYGLSVICLISAIFSYKKSLDSLNDRIKFIKKGG